MGGEILTRAGLRWPTGSNRRSTHCRGNARGSSGLAPRPQDGCLSGCCRHIAGVRCQDYKASPPSVTPTRFEFLTPSLVPLGVRPCRDVHRCAHCGRAEEGLACGAGPVDSEGWLAHRRHQRHDPALPAGIRLRLPWPTSSVTLERSGRRRTRLASPVTSDTLNTPGGPRPIPWTTSASQPTASQRKARWISKARSTTLIPGIDVLLAKRGAAWVVEPRWLPRLSMIARPRCGIRRGHGSNRASSEIAQDWYTSSPTTAITTRLIAQRVRGALRADSDDPALRPRPLDHGVPFRVLPRHAGVPAAGLQAIRSAVPQG